LTVSFSTALVSDATSENTTLLSILSDIWHYL
jgi:hypothetical protein